MPAGSENSFWGRVITDADLLFSYAPVYLQFDANHITEILSFGLKTEIAVGTVIVAAQEIQAAYWWCKATGSVGKGLTYYFWEVGRFVDQVMMGDLSGSGATIEELKNATKVKMASGELVLGDVCSVIVEGEIIPEIIGKTPELGRKLEYVFGNATGSQHNIDRSLSMANQLNHIGIHDDSIGRAIVEDHIVQSFYATNNGITQANGRILKESLLSGPGGFLKVQTVWDGPKLITILLFDGGIMKP